jgi:integrase/recombinase XerD
LQLHLGHESVRTTELYLTFLTPEETRAALDRPAQKPEHVQRSEDAGSA